MGKLPYVISAELEFVRPGLARPEAVEGFRETLDTDLRGMGKDTLWVDAALLRNGLRDLCQRTSLPVVSLDDRYIEQGDAEEFLGISRAIQPDFSDAGYDARLGYLPLSKQFDNIGRRFSGQSVVLADDVVFSGEMIGFVKDELERRGVGVTAVACGLIIGEGAEKLSALGVDVESVMSIDDVDDEICERDFTLSVGSGRKIAGAESNALYFDGRFGRPGSWASIPEAAIGDFCASSLLRNRRLLPADAPAAGFAGYPAGTNGELIEWRLALEGRGA